MLNAEHLKEAEQRRLAWRCRRGMLELDMVLQRFVLAQFNQLSLAEMQVFDEMLELPDNDFWALIQSTTQQENLHLQSVITQLKTVCVHPTQEAA